MKEVMSNNVKIIPPEKTFKVGDLVLVDPLYIGDDLAAKLYFSQTQRIQENASLKPLAGGWGQPWPWGIIIESNTVYNKTQHKISFSAADVWVSPENIRHIEKET